MNKNNSDFNEDRFIKNHEKKFTLIKVSVIIAIITGTLIAATEGILVSSTQRMNAADLANYILYRDGEIDYEEYNDRRYDLMYNLYQTTFLLSIVTNIARIGLNIAFIFVIIGLLSISSNRSFNKKMRRISLALASIILLIMMASIFIPTASVIYYIY